jgi:hypothetical protein
MKNFEELLKEYSYEYKSQEGRIKESNNFFSKNYLENSKYSSFSLPFVPGIIYSFQYKTPAKISEKRKFINRNPIFLFLNYTKSQEYGNILHGIDLSTSPYEAREVILSRIWNLFKEKISKNSNPKEKKEALPLSPENLDSILNKTGYRKSIFGFKYEYFYNTKEIKSEDWVRIPFLELNTFEGLSSFEIYKEYKSKLK